MSNASQEHSQPDEFITEGDGNHISDVVVFTDQAYINRRVRAQTQAGLNRILIEIKAIQVDADSVQAAVYGEGEILSVQYRRIPVKDAPQEHIKELDLKKEELLRQRSELQAGRDVQEKQKRFLDSLIGFAETEIPKEIKTHFPETENVKTMLEFLGENYEKLAGKDMDLGDRIKELNDEISVVERKLKQSQRPKKATNKAIEVLFDSQKIQEIDIEASYVVKDVAWEPVYKVDVPIDVSCVRLTMFSRINQRTGENWKNVNLTVSTAVPLKGAAIPTLESWYVSLPSGPVPIAAAAALGEDEKAYASMDDILGQLEEGAGEAEADFVQAEQKELPIAFEYELPQRVSMDSGAVETVLPLFTKELKGDFFAYAVPKRDVSAYLVCRAAVDKELLTGRLNVHFGGRFVGGVHLPEKLAGEDFLLNLGVDRGLRVRRERVTDKLTETFFGVVDRSSVAREFEYRIYVENLKEEVARVHILDGIPVSTTDRIQVKGVETAPKPTLENYQGKEGVMLWELSVKPKSVQEIRVKFFVKHPKDALPYGL